MCFFVLFVVLLPFVFCGLCFAIFPRLKLALGVLTSVEQLVPVLRPPACPEVPRGLGSSPVGSCAAPPCLSRGSSGLGFLACLDVWTFRRMDV